MVRQQFAPVALGPMSDFFIQMYDIIIVNEIQLQYINMSEASINSSV